MEEHYYSQEINFKKNNLTKWLFISNIVLVLAVGAMYYLHFTGKKGTTTKQIVKVQDSKGVSIAYINTDTLMKNYEFVDDQLGKLEELERNYQLKLDNESKQFKADYENYIKNGEKLSYSQQQATEKALTEKNDELMKLNQNLTEKFQTMRDEYTSMVLDTVLSYINRFNIEAGYTYIFERSFRSNLLYADSINNITTEIVDGLNEEYKTWKDNLKK